MSYDYLQFQTESRFFDFDRTLFVERKPTRSGLPRKGLNVREIVSRQSLPPCLTNRIMLEVTADAHVTIGLPSTLLGAQYLNRIDDKNFDLCLRALTEHGLVRDIDIEGLRENSKVVRLEIACDVIATKNPTRADYRRFRVFLRNPYRWKQFQLQTNSFGVSARKEQLKVYGKSKEMRRRRHTAFKSKYGIVIPDNLVRIEYRLNSAEKVKQHFGSKRLIDILQMEENVLGQILRKTFVEIEPSELYLPKVNKAFKSRLSIAQEHDYDFQRIQDAVQDWGKHKVAKLRDVHQALISTQRDMQYSGNILRELIELQSIN